MLTCWLNNKKLLFLKTNKGVCGKCNTSVETSLLSDALKACANELDTTQEKDEKGWRSIEKDYLEHFVLVWLRFAHI